MLKMRKDSPKSFSHIVCEDLPGIFLAKRSSMVGCPHLVEAGEAFVGIPDSSQESIHIMSRFTFQNCAM